jgi:hypothetical protein
LDYILAASTHPIELLLSLLSLQDAPPSGSTRIIPDRVSPLNSIIVVDHVARHITHPQIMSALVAPTQDFSAVEGYCVCLI